MDSTVREHIDRLKSRIDLLSLEMMDVRRTVEGEDLRGATGTVGHHEAQVGSGGGVFGFVADAALPRPTARAMAEAGETALRYLGAAITVL